MQHHVDSVCISPDSLLHSPAHCHGTGTVAGCNAVPQHHQIFLSSLSFMEQLHATIERTKEICEIYNKFTPFWLTGRKNANINCNVYVLVVPNK